MSSLFLNIHGNSTPNLSCQQEPSSCFIYKTNFQTKSWWRLRRKQHTNLETQKSHFSFVRNFRLIILILLNEIEQKRRNKFEKLIQQDNFVFSIEHLCQSSINSNDNPQKFSHFHYLERIFLVQSEIEVPIWFCEAICFCSLSSHSQLLIVGVLLKKKLSV